MANEVLANGVPAPPPDGAPSEDDYRAFCAALEASARGRAFLAEYARRNRHADTETVLAALDRLATLVRSQAATAEAERIRQELRALLAAMRSAQPAIDASAAAIKAVKLAALIGFVQHRIESIVAPAREHSPLPAEVAVLVMAGDAAVDAARAHLAVVPRADEPELPIPAPAAAPAPTIALVQEPIGAAPEPGPQKPEPEAPQPVLKAPQPIAEVTASPPARPSAAIMPDVNLFEGAPAQPVVVAPEPSVPETMVVETAVIELAVDTLQTPLIPAQAEVQDSNLRSEDFDPASPLEPVLGPAEGWTRVRGRAADSAQMETALEPVTQPETIETPPSDDPLALIMALSEAERIALFS